MATDLTQDAVERSDLQRIVSGDSQVMLLTAKLPRDVSGQELVAALAVLGYEVTRQTGSHVRLTTQLGGEQHHLRRYPGHRHDDSDHPGSTDLEPCLSG